MNPSYAAGRGQLYRLTALLFATSFFVSPASAEKCTSASLVLHCTSRCAGINTTTVAASNPPPEQVLAPPSADILAQLENEAEGVRVRKSRFSLFAQLGEGAVPPPRGGSPTVPSEPSAANFSDQTAYAPAHRALSPEQLMAFIGPANSLEWVPLSTASFGCVDGRHATGGLYAYGGDLGEFALGLSVLEHVAQRQIGQAETTRLLEAWLRTLHQSGGGFGSCVDAASVASLGAAVGLGEKGSSSSSALDLNNPPEELKPQLLLRLVTPEFVGDTHLKWLLHYPQTYATRAPLVAQVVRSYFGILWNVHHPSQPALKLHVLEGSRSERAVVHVHTSHWCAKEQHLAPTLPSKTRGGSALLYHPDAVSQRRVALVGSLRGSVTPPVEGAELLARVQTLGDGQAALTEKALAGMLRSYALMVK